MDVIKRDGRKQEFDFTKVEEVIHNTYKALNKEIPSKFIDSLREAFNKKLKGKTVVDVEDIQDIIQNELINKKQYDIVEEFIIYRNKRAEARERKSDLIKAINKKLNGTNIENQNANVDEASFGGRMGEATRIVTKNDALKYRMSKKSRKNHENNEIYIHDLDSYSSGMHNCLSVPIDKLLVNGFKTRQTDVRPAGSINTAMQLVAVIFQLQSLQQFGGVSATHIDWSMVPYVRMSFYKHFKNGLKYVEGYTDHGIDNIIDFTKQEAKNVSIEDDLYKIYHSAYHYAMDMTKKECHQACEGMYHNLNTLQSRSGNQLPFSSINYGTCTEPEGRMVIEALLNVSIEGLGKNNKTSIFPCGIFQYMKGVNDKPGTPNYDMYQLALKSTSQRLYPNYCNVDWSNQRDWKEYDIKVKEDIINSLNEEEYNKLLLKIENNPEIGEILGLEIIEE